MRPNDVFLATALTRPSTIDAAPAYAEDAFTQLARALAPLERAAVSAALRALVQRAEAEGAASVAAAIVEADRTVRAAPTRNDDLMYLPFMAVYPGDDELA
jgi:hypothetical protein